MPITLKTARMRYKNPTTGQYVGVNSVGDADLAEQIQAVEDSIAPDYTDLVFPVAAGQKCYYENRLYEANQAISTSEVWTVAHWELVTIDGELSSLKNALNQSNAATNSDIGKAHSPKTVVDGKVTEWKYVEVGGGGGQTDIGLSVVNGEICVTYEEASA